MSELPPSTSPWARIHVVRGASPQRLLLCAEQPAHLFVGSDPQAHIHLPEPCVAPRQFDVLWDGDHLWLEDKLRLGRTFVNGRLLNEWVLVQGEVIVSFGSLRLWMAAKGSDLRPSCPDFQALERALAPRGPGRDELLRASHNSQTGRFAVPTELACLLNAAADLPA